METIVLLVHLLAALVVIGLIMLQQGKGAEMGASFGAGASQTLFGSAGSGNFFSRMTAIFATVFFVTSFSLAVIAKQKTNVNDDLGLPMLEQIEAPAADSAPDNNVSGSLDNAQDEAAEAVTAAADDISDLEPADDAPVAEEPVSKDVPELPAEQ